MEIFIKPKSFNREITASASKSYEQRFLALSLLTGEKTVLKNFGNSADVIAARNIIKTLGCDFFIKNNKLIIKKRKQFSDDYIPTLECGESGLCARLFVPVAAVLYKNFIVKASGSLLNRNIYEDYKSLSDFGFNFSSENNNFPFNFYDCELKAGNYKIDGKNSSQLVSGLLMALSCLPEPSVLKVENAVSIKYMQMTVDALQRFGFQLIDEYGETCNFKIYPKRLALDNYKFKIEGDWSGISNVLVAGALIQDIKVKGLNQYSLQADKAILEVFDLAGVRYKWKNSVLKIFKSRVNSFEFDATNCPDLIPAIVILAVFAKGKSLIHGISRLINKESSRAEVLQKELAKAGITLQIDGDAMIIQGEQKPNFAVLDSNGDHRMAMAFSILGLNSENGIKITNADVVEKSWANYYNELIIE